MQIIIGRIHLNLKFTFNFIQFINVTFARGLYKKYKMEGLSFRNRFFP